MRPSVDLNRRDEPWRHLLFEPGFLFFWLLGLTVFRRVLFFGEVTYYRDIFLLSAGQLGFLSEALRSGHGIPLWNPLHQGGLPFLADVNNQALYPTSWLSLVFEPFRALSVSIFLHVMGAGTATYLWIRRLGAGHLAAFVGASIFAFCGPTLSHANTPGRLFALCLLPPMLLCWHEALSEGRRGPFLAASLLAGLQTLAGAPDLDVLSYGTLVLWGLVAGGRSSAAGALARAFGLGMLKAGLAAVQVLPLAKLTLHSRRAAGMPLEELGAHSIYPGRWPELVVGGFFGVDSLDPSDYWGRFAVDGAIPYVVSITFGCVALLLAVLGAVTENRSLDRPRRLVLSALAAAGVTAAMGLHLPGFAWAYAHLPGIQLFRFPSKVLALVVLPVAVLAAFGLEAILRDRGRRGVARLAMLTAGLLVGIAALLSVPATAPFVEVLFFRHSGEAASGGLPALLLRSALPPILLAFALKLLRDPRQAAAAGALLVAVELGLTTGTAMHTADSRTVTEVPEILGMVASRLDAGRETPGRLFRDRSTWPEHLETPDLDPVWRHVWLKQSLSGYQGARFGLPMVFHEDFHSLFAERTVNLAFLVHEKPWAERLRWLAVAAVSVVATDAPLDLPGLSLEAALTPPLAPDRKVYVYRLDEPLERATAVFLWRSVGDPLEGVGYMLQSSFDPARHAVVEGDAPLPDPTCRGAAEIRLEVWENDRFVYRVQTPCPTLLRVSEIFDDDRRFTVDGLEVESRRVDYAWSGVFLTPGEHRVEGRYAPPVVPIGGVISAVTLLLMGLLWLRRPRR